MGEGPTLNRNISFSPSCAPGQAELQASTRTRSISKHFVGICACTNAAPSNTNSAAPNLWPIPVRCMVMVDDLRYDTPVGAWSDQPRMELTKRMPTNRS